MMLTSELFTDFLKCPTKCYLRSTGQAGTGNAYAEWVREQNDGYRVEAGRRLLAEPPKAEVSVAPPGSKHFNTAAWRLAVDLPLETETMASQLQTVERVPSQGRSRPAQFIPIRFSVFNKLTRDDQLLVVFDALVLSDAVGREIGVVKSSTVTAMTNCR